MDPTRRPGRRPAPTARLQVFPRAVTKTACIASWQERPGRNPYDRDSNRASHSGSSAPAVRACSALSAITGMPSPRRFPPALGMKTRLTGLGLHAAAPCWSQAAISAFSRPPSTILPSTPAVLRPALTSVTRRTLSSAFARERSISFCRLRTFFRSPALLAVKIRCRSRRTSSSARRQSTASQSRTSSSGPFTMMVSNLPIGSGVSVHQVVTGSPDPRQLPFGPGISPYPASYAEAIRRRCQSCGPGFLLPFGYRHSLLGSSCARWGIEPSSRSAYRPPRGRTPTGLSCCACASCDRAGRSLYPGDGGAFPAGDYLPAGTCRSSTASPCGPAGTSHRRGELSRDVSESSRHSPITPGPAGYRPRAGNPACRLPPVFSSPAAPGWNTGRFGFCPGLRTPQLPATHARAETGHHALARVLHPRPQPGLQRCLPLELMHPHVARSRWLPPSPPRAPASTAASPPAPAPPAWWCRSCGSRSPAAPGCLSDGTRIVATMLGLADVDAAHPVPVQRLVGHLFHASLTSPFPRTAHLPGDTARGTGGERRNLTRVLEAAMNGPSGNRLPASD